MLAFVAAETVGLLGAAFPAAWLGLFGADPGMIAAGSSYLRIVGPTFGFFGFGMALYFASQGAGRLAWPLAVTVLRTTIAIGGAVAVYWAVFTAVAIGIIVYGLSMAVVTVRTEWRAPERAAT